MELIVNILSWIFILAGSFFIVIGALGLMRMPDIYTRMHAASVIDTTGAGFLVLGLILQAGLSLIALKLLFILAIFFFTGPVVSHALAQAALAAGVEPELAEDRRGQTTATPAKDGKSKEIP
ncbi:MAG TPA: monovalent cation/H(+) antiporter subunit G [Caldilineaceae bacterium]|nr:monovalent cation/H(+) antiporter subunit G [Caldilineaceae bacterium]